MKFQGSIIGRLTTDVKTKDNMIYFSVAINRKRNGQETTDFVNCFCYGNSAKTAQEYVKKGHLVDLFGEVTLQVYNEKASANLSVDRLTLIQPRDKAASPPKAESPAEPPKRTQPKPQRQTRPTPPLVVEENDDEYEDLDDQEIPF